MKGKNQGQGKKPGSDLSHSSEVLNPKEKEMFLKQYGKQKDWTDEEIEMALLLGYR